MSGRNGFGSDRRRRDFYGLGRNSRIKKGTFYGKNEWNA